MQRSTRPYLRFLGVVLCLACERSDAATSFSFLVDRGLLKILPASDAAFFPVVIIFPSIGETDAPPYAAATALGGKRRPGPAD
jgi:hypothetical protein